MPYNLYLKKGEERRILEGHPWIYANEVLRIEGKDKQGSIAKVYAHDGRFIGQGYINHLSKIIVRLLSYNERDIDENFFKEKLINAINLRKELFPEQNALRLVFSEADGLPGLIVDKYADYLVLQILTLGMELRKDIIIDILQETLNPVGIYERSDSQVREKEGLEEFKGLLKGEIPELIEITENGIKMLVDVVNGQKTGHFLDQKENRAAIAPYVKSRRVLDCFSHTGGFALHAAHYGAREVVACDISETAVASIERNAGLNGLNIKTVTADVFEYLRNLRLNKEQFDTIILDPPAFTKNRETINNAIRGYRDINIQAMKILRAGGYLISSSCSHFITNEMFLNMLREASLSAGVRLRLIEFRSQARDHSVLLGSEESNYLKFAVLKAQD